MSSDCEESGQRPLQAWCSLAASASALSPQLSCVGALRPGCAVYGAQGEMEVGAPSSEGLQTSKAAMARPGTERGVPVGSAGPYESAQASHLWSWPWGPSSSSSSPLAIF